LAEILVYTAISGFDIVYRLGGYEVWDTRESRGRSHHSTYFCYLGLTGTYIHSRYGVRTRVRFNFHLELASWNSVMGRFIVALNSDSGLRKATRNFLYACEHVSLRKCVIALFSFVICVQSMA